jgi:hypothetical protein
MAVDLQSQLRSMRKGLDLPPQEVDLKKIVPIFVPASFFSLGNWPGPYQRLRCLEIGLTWTVMLPDQAMRYVDLGMADHWDSLGIDWKAVALQNLAEHSGEKPCSHGLCRPSGEPYAVAFMHPDGMGPSRLLFREAIFAIFPDGYQVALPEMSCGLAFSTTLDGEERAKIDNVIRDCHRKGTRPLSPLVYSPDDLLPELAAN